MSLIELPLLGPVPFEWFLVLLVAFILFIATVGTVIMYAFTHGSKGPIEEDLALVVPVDEHGTFQTGQLLGGVKRTEDKLLVKNPDWQDEERNEYVAELDIDSGGGTKVPLPFFDIAKALKRLWVVMDQGDLTVVSFATFIKGLPKRWDPPLSDRRKTFRFLVSHNPAQTITNALTGSVTGFLTMTGLVGGGMLLSFFLITVSGHLH